MKAVCQGPGNGLISNHESNFDISDPKGVKHTTISRFYRYSASEIVHVKEIAVLENVIGASRVKGRVMLSEC